MQYGELFKFVAIFVLGFNFGLIFCTWSDMRRWRREAREAREARESQFFYKK